MHIRKRHPRAWAAIPAIVLIVAISVVAGRAQATSTLTAGPLDALVEPTVTLNVGVTALRVPVAVVRIPRLPLTSTSAEFEQLKPVNFVQGFALGFAMVLVAGLLMLGSRRST